MPLGDLTLEMLQGYVDKRAKEKVSALHDPQGGADAEGRVAMGRTDEAFTGRNVPVRWPPLSEAR